MDYKDRIQSIAEEIAQDRHGADFYDLPERTRDAVYREASERAAESYGS